jgi:hypothetical protein
MNDLFTGYQFPWRKTVEDSAPYDHYDFGRIEGWAVPGNNNYRMCWASVPVLPYVYPFQPADYKIDIGTFTLLGPMTPTEPGCPLTILCSIHLTGLGLSNSDGLLIIAGTETCGSAAAKYAEVQGEFAVTGNHWTNPGQVTATSTTEDIVFGTPVAGA